jgi:hypothetical protein
MVSKGGNPIHNIQAQINEHYNVGENVAIIFQLDKPITPTQLAAVEKEVVSRGVKLTSPVQFGSTSDWDNALYMQFKRPASKGVAALPIMLVVAAIGVIVGGIAAWKFTSEATKEGNLTKTLLIGGGVAIVVAGIYFYSKRKK